MTKSERIRACLLLLPLFFLNDAARAQGPRGSITGLVTDSTGAVIAGAKVIATNTSTAVKTSTTTNETGYYSIAYLNPGPYSVSVELRGFRTVLRKDLEVEVGDRLGLNFKLEPADLQTSIEVTSGSTPLLETASASVGTVVDRRRITELPLSDGNPMTLELLSAGLMFTNEVMNSQHTFDNGGSSGIRTDGAPGGNTFSVDGVPNTANARGQGGGSPQGGLNVAFMPPAEAVEEFKVETAAFDAQHGHTPGANINVSIRNGTNQVHGSAYEFYRPPELVAQEFFAKRSGLAAQDFSYHRYGGTLGGPVRIPSVYDGRNKTFFFASYDVNALDTPSVALYSIPTLAERGGDFSKLSSTMYDPLSAVQEGSRIRRQPFPNNVIPQGRLSPIGVNYLKYYPQPNQPGLATGENNLLANNSTTDDFNWV